MRAFLGAACAAMVWQRAILRAFVIFCLACLAGACFTTPSISAKLSDPGPLSARASKPWCPRLPFPSYLSADQKMMIATGTWGRSIHPRSPNFFRFQREMRFERERDSGPGKQSGSSNLAKCDSHTASSDIHAA